MIVGFKYFLLKSLKNLNFHRAVLDLEIHLSISFAVCYHRPIS